jgi:dihydrodipicolinate reductase
MRIALIGYGKMGKTIEEIALTQGHTIAGTFDIDRPADVKSLADADICIEFSTPATAVDNIRTAIAARKMSWSAPLAGTIACPKFAKLWVRRSRGFSIPPIFPSA